MKVFIFIVAIFGIAYGQDTAKWKPFVCSDGVYKLNDDRMAEVGACKSANPKCAYFYQATALGVLNKDGLPTQEIYDQYVADSWPQEHKALATAHFRDCLKKFGKFIDKTDKSDTECKYAKLFGDCTWSVQPQMSCPMKA